MHPRQPSHNLRSHSLLAVLGLLLFLFFRHLVFSLLNDLPVVYPRNGYLHGLDEVSREENRLECAVVDIP